MSLAIVWLVGTPTDGRERATGVNAAALQPDEPARAAPVGAEPLPEPSALARPSVTAEPETAAGASSGVRLAGDIVHGRVLSLPGAEPLADAEVELLTAGDRPETWLSGGRSLGATRASSAGRYHLEGITAGRYRVRASAPHLATSTSAPFELDGSGATHEIDMLLAEPGQLVGRVVDEDGAPISEAFVTLHPELSHPDELPLLDQLVETEVDARGVFVVDDLAPGTWIVSARRIDADLRRALDAGLPGSMLLQMMEPGTEPPEPARADVPPGEPGEVLVVLPTRHAGRPCRLSGVLTGRLPPDVLSYEVEVSYSTLPDSAGTNTSLQSETVAVGADGRFVFDALPARATATLWVHARSAGDTVGAASGRVSHESVALPGGGDAWIDVDLPPHGSVELSVLDAVSGAPLEDAYLSWFADGRVLGGHTLSRQPLTLVFPSGTYALRPNAPTHELHRVSVEITAGRAAAPLELRLARAKPWRPRLVGPGGAPLESAPARLALSSWDGDPLGIGEMVLVDLETHDGARRILADQLHEGRFDAWLIDADGASSAEGSLDLRRGSDTAIFETR